MRMRRTTKARGRAAVTVLTAVMALAVAGCGDDGGDKGEDGADARSSKKPAAQHGEAKNRAREPASDGIGEMEGPDGTAIALTSAVRDKGGFVTVNGTLTNRGSRPFNAIHWSSKETEMKSRSSVSGASLVDQASKKRYLVLRDTDGECLCSTGLTNVKPNETRPVFAQFPAPPDDVTEVDFQLPAMPSVHIKISG
ncbi:hypothetical protein [Streptomyces telluris]|uniref:Secreted protein n=1 Tax=Streptomyces telluris TaxID=2720021 RepID=A0A9X2LFG3_9ACTN|nr:hypothetical protein [Streptomyces telluris]MCQ8770178.1 hypothetical protein [Streptomyces telluris]NJP81509.1 hypothetical protein [Streptomyces telluris]